MPASPRAGTKAPTARLPLSRDRILAQALEIADECGLGAITMREVASRLGVEAMSLYNHVANKDDILDGMVDLVAAQIDLPDDAVDWRDAMRRRAVSAHEVFGSHSWAPLLLDSRQSSGPARLRYFDWVLGTLMDAGFSEEAAVRSFSVLDSYIYGFSIQQFNVAVGSEESTPEEMAEMFLEVVPAQTYPHLHRVVSYAMVSGYDAGADFHFGLELILDGLERLLPDA